MTSDSKPIAKPLGDVDHRTTIQQSPSEEARSASASIEIVTIPGYEIEAELGRGGVGVVYKARQVGLNRRVALKMVLAGPYADPGTRARFLIEAESVAALEHPNVVRVFAFGEHAGYPFLAMEYLPAGNLAAYAKLRGPLPAWEAASLMTKLASAVAHAHSRGVIHRDIKPGNVLLTDDGSPKLTDFGLAKVDRSELSVTGQVLGTPSYMSPEQAAGKVREVGPATDVYALGAVLYELLTGQPPFSGGTVADTLLLVIYTEPKRLRKFNPLVPRDLETICLKCLEKEPRNRYLSVQELVADLGRFQAGSTIHARPAGPFERSLKWARRHKWSLAILGLVLLLQTGIAAALYHSLLRFDDQARQPIVTPQPALPNTPIRNPEYRALLIGCSEYRGITQDLPGARKDSLRLARLLIQQYGFPEQNVVLLTGSIDLPETVPTREMIEKRIRELTAVTQPGDQVVIQFSGHGVGIPPEGKEQYRDCFIPSPSTEAVRQWSFFGNFSSLNNPVITGPTGTQSVWEKAKNLEVLQPIYVAESHKWLKAITDKGASLWVIYAVQGSSGLGIENTPTLDDDLRADIPNFVITYACKPSEISLANNRGGLFIQSICDVLETGNSRITYGELLQRVRPRVKQRVSEFEDPETGTVPTQTPWLAGGNRGGFVLGGKVSGPQPK